MKSHSPKAQQHLVDLWNSKYPPGTPVTVRRDDGEATITKTTSAAALLGGHTACVMLEGISGCYLLTRCSPIKEQAASAIVAKVMSGIRSKTPN